MFQTILDPVGTPVIQWQKDTSGWLKGQQESLLFCYKEQLHTTCRPGPAG